MKPPSLLVTSLLCNLVLAAIFLAARHRPAVISPVTTAAVENTVANTPLSRSVAAAEASAPAQALIWRQIESADYRRYIENLRAADCPDWLVRDIIVADVDDFYGRKSAAPATSFEPWQSAVSQHQTLRARSVRINALAQEKRALVKSLLGYEWQNDADSLWNQNLLTSLTDGFLPDDKAARLWELRDGFNDEARGIREAANFILIEEDRARLGSLYAQYRAALARLLSATQLDELDLRSQKNFLSRNDVHFDGVNLGPEELRRFVRQTKSIKDIALADFIPESRLSENGRAQRQAAIELTAGEVLGAARLPDFRRAQDSNFRQIFEFSERDRLPLATAVTVYRLQRDATGEAEDIRQDTGLAPTERATALAVLKAATINSLTTALGASWQNYLSGPGGWLENFAADTSSTAP